MNTVALDQVDVDAPMLDPAAFRICLDRIGRVSLCEPGETDD